MASHRRVGIEAWRQRVRDLIQIEQRLADHRELSRQADTVFARDLHDFEQSAADADLVERGILVTRDDGGERAPEIRLVRIFPTLPDKQEHIGRVLGTIVTHRKQILQQSILQLWRYARHHAQVDKRDAVVDQKHVARMRVGMEEPIGQYLFEIRPEQRLGKVKAVDLQLRQRTQGGDPSSVLARRYSPALAAG